MGKARKLVKGGSLRTIALIVNIVAMFFIMPYMINSLGNKVYGLWALIISFTGYYFVLDFGISQSVTRYISKALGANKKEDIPKIVSNSMALFALVGLFSILITIGLLFFISGRVPDDLRFDSYALIFFVGLEFAISLPLRTYAGLMRAHLDFDWASYIEICKVVLRSLLFVAVIHFSLGLIYLGAVNFFANIGFYIASYIYSKRKYENIGFRFSLIEKRWIKKLSNFSVWVFLTGLGDILRFRIDIIMITIFIGLSDVTAYQIPVKIIDYFMALMIALTGIMMPVFANQHGAKDMRSIKRSFFASTRMSTIFAFLIGGLMIIFGRSFITNWIGPGFDVSYKVLLILAVPYMFDLSQRMGYSVMQGLNKHYIYAIINGVEGLMNLLLTIILVGKYGLIGVALGTAIPLFFIKGLLQPVLVCRMLKISLLDYIREILGIIVVMSGSVVLLYVLISGFGILNYVMMITYGVISVLLLIVIIYAVCLNSSERKAIRKILSRSLS